MAVTVRLLKVGIFSGLRVFCRIREPRWKALVLGRQRLLDEGGYRLILRGGIFVSIIERDVVDAAGHPDLHTAT